MAVHIGHVRRWLCAGPAIAPLLRESRHARDTPRALHATLDTLLDACQQINTRLHQPSEINPVDILSWPGVVAVHAEGWQLAAMVGLALVLLIANSLAMLTGWSG